MSLLAPIDTLVPPFVSFGRLKRPIDTIEPEFVSFLGGKKLLYAEGVHSKHPYYLLI